MPSKRISRHCVWEFTILASLLLAASKGGAEPVDPAATEGKTPPVQLPEARRRAALLHAVFESTLYSMHRNYFKPDRQMPIPSRALEGVFYRVSQSSGVKARWLAVDAQAMTLDHKPKDAFERAAVKALSRGRAWHEEVAEDEYRRAGSITLFSACIKCHTSSKPNPVAALVIRVPYGDR